MTFNLKDIHDEITEILEVSYPRIIISDGIPAKGFNDEELMLIRVKEFKRILDEDGIVFIAGKFEAVKTFNDDVFQNKQIKDLLKVLKKFFKVSYEFVDLGDLNSKYYAIYLKK